MADIASQFPNLLRVKGTNASDQAKLLQNAVQNELLGSEEPSEFEDLTRSLKGDADPELKSGDQSKPKPKPVLVESADRKLLARLDGQDASTAPTKDVRPINVQPTSHGRLDQSDGVHDREPRPSPIVPETTVPTVNTRAPLETDGLPKDQPPPGLEHQERPTAERQPTPTPPPLPEFAEQLAPTFTAGDREAVRQHSQSRPETVLQTVHAQVPSRSERHGNGLADVAADPLTSSPHKPDQRASLPPVAIARPSAVGASQGDRASNGLRSTAQRTASETVPELSSKLAATADVRDDTVTRVVEAEAPAKARAQHMELGLRVLAQETHFDPEPPKPVRILSEKISSALRGMSDEQFATRSLGASGQVPSNDATSDTLRILSIQLEPERLGAVRARIELKGNMVQIELAANNQDAKAIIQKDSDALVNMLRSAGYVVSEETIRVIDLPRNEQLNSILQQTTTSDADTSSDGSDRAAGDRNHRDRTGSQRDDRADDDARGQPENEAPSSGRRGLYV